MKYWTIKWLGGYWPRQKNHYKRGQFFYYLSDIVNGLDFILLYDFSKRNDLNFTHALRLKWLVVYRSKIELVAGMVVALNRGN